MSRETVLQQLASTERKKSMTAELMPRGIVVAAILIATTFVGGLPFLGGVVGTLAVAGVFAAISYFSNQKYNDYVNQSASLTKELNNIDERSGSKPVADLDRDVETPRVGRSATLNNSRTVDR